MMETEILVAEESVNESVLYLSSPEEGMGDEEKREDHMSRLKVIEEKVAKADRGIKALKAVKDEERKASFEQIQLARRARETEQKRLAGLKRANEARKKNAVYQELTAEQMYEAMLKEEYDEPKSKLRQRKSKEKPTSEGDIGI